MVFFSDRALMFQKHLQLNIFDPKMNFYNKLQDETKTYFDLKDKNEFIVPYDLPPVKYSQPKGKFLSLNFKRLTVLYHFNF